MPDSTFAADFRDLLSKHSITHPAFAHNAEAFDPAKPRVLYSGPVFDQEELVAATVALCQGKWSVNGEYTHRFEREFSKVGGQADTVMVNSGSSADLLMIAAAKKRYGWKDGDGVIVSPVGFPTSISAITLNALTPVFVDIEWDTLNFDLDWILDELEGQFAPPEIINGEPRYRTSIVAILVSPVLGNPPDIDRLTALATKHGVTLLLDGCDSLGSTWNGRPLPEYFAASTCSFYPAHHISTLNGGAISSNDPELITIARSMTQWGRDCVCVGAANYCLPNGVCGKRFSRWLPDVDCDLDHRYVYSNTGYNLQQLDICAAMGLEQLKKLDWIHDRRFGAYLTTLSAMTKELSPEVKWSRVRQHKRAIVSWFGFPVILDDPAVKARLVAHLESRGIQTRSYFAGNLLAHPAYAHLGTAADFPNAQQVLCRVFWLGTSPSYTAEHFAHIEKALKEFTL